MFATHSAITPQLPEFLDTREVEQFAKLSYATLKRRQREGHDTGLRKRGRRVLFHVPTLTKFLLSDSATPIANTPTSN